MQQRTKGREVKMHNGGDRQPSMKSNADTTADIIIKDLIQDHQDHPLLLGQVGTAISDN